MAKIKKLTPDILKKIIKEEKEKISQSQIKENKTQDIESSIDKVTKLALVEAKYLLRIKKLREARNLLKKRIARKTK